MSLNQRSFFTKKILFADEKTQKVIRLELLFTPNIPEGTNQSTISRLSNRNTKLKNTVLKKITPAQTWSKNQSTDLQFFQQR